jgi:hypothetical protein
MSKSSSRSSGDVDLKLGTASVRSTDNCDDLLATHPQLGMPTNIQRHAGFAIAEKAQAGGSRAREALALTIAPRPLRGMIVSLGSKSPR